MAFAVSPGVYITEKDLTNVIPAVSTTIGGFAGLFQWGPCNQAILVSSEDELVQLFGKPIDTNFEYWFTCANFLGYGNALRVVRATSSTYSRNANAAGATGSTAFVMNQDDYETKTFGSYCGAFTAKYPGELGNSLQVQICGVGSTAFNSFGVSAQFDSAPDTSDYVDNIGGTGDEIHIAVVDNLGYWTGTPGTVLERFPFVSVCLDAKKSDGSSNYYKNVINDTSKYIWWTAAPSGLTAAVGSAAAAVDYTGTLTAATYSLTGGTGGIAGITAGRIQAAYDQLADPDTVDVALLLAGPSDASAVIPGYVIDIAVARKDCVAFVSPSRASCVGATDPVTTVKTFRNTTLNKNTSYAVMDSGYVRKYDKYNDVFRYVPLNGDVAGLCARTDDIADPWFSPAGFNRGQIRGAVNLAWKPDKADRDELYKAGINPVVAFPGDGTVLYGDKTLLSKPSAFDRINVRRLFIVLEKAIAIAAKYMLFEFNDEFTRGQFRNLVEPFLRDVQSRRGIVDFRVVCDETNNTQEVIDGNRFVGDIYIKPARSINFINLNFIATRSGVSFDEVSGGFGAGVNAPTGGSQNIGGGGDA